LDSLRLIISSGVDFSDPNILSYQIPQKISEEFTRNDAYLLSSNSQSHNSHSPTNLHDSDYDVNKDQVEVRVYTDVHHMTLTLNDVPFFIGKNTLGFIPYVLASTTDPTQIIGYEWLPFLLRWPEQLLQSILNNHIDGIRSIASPNFSYPKWAITDDETLKNLAPWEAIPIEPEYANQGIKRIEKWTVSDFWVFDLSMKIAQYISWASEYNLWISARERTATGAAAVTQSSQKRLSPFMAQFVQAISDVLKIQLRFMQEFYLEKKLIKTLNISNKDLIGPMNISLDIDSLTSTIDELASRNLLETYAQFASSWIINERTTAEQIFKAKWLSPDKFIRPEAPEVTTPRDMPPMDTNAPSPTMEQLGWNMLTQAMNPVSNG
jgi:hypothetical protein